MKTAAQSVPLEKRLYDKQRRDRIGQAMLGALLMELKDQDGVVVLPVREIMDAMALLCGVMLAADPAAKTPSHIRTIADEHAKLIRQRVKDAATADLDSIFTGGVLEGPVFQ